jgi:hypothetical protein
MSIMMNRYLLAFLTLPPILCRAERQAPLHPVVLLSSQLEVVLDREQGLPFQYHLLQQQATIQGEDTGRDITVSIFRSEPRSFDKIAARLDSVRATGTSADFQFSVRAGGRTAASFVLRYELKGATVFVSLESVEEKPGFQLLEVATPDLATVREEDGPAWLAHGDQGGSTVALSNALAGRLHENRFWGGVAATLPVVMIGTNKALCVQEVLAFMDTTELAVEGAAGHRRAGLGTIKTYRANGSLSYDMNTGTGTPRIFGNEKTPNLLVGQRPLCRLDFAGDLDRNGVVDWLDGAKLVRARMPEIPTHYYDDKLMYQLHCDQPKWPQPAATFAQAANLIRQVAALTAQAPQNAYLWGWQYRGKDTGYPAVAEVNPRLGGYDGLMTLIEDGRKVNATVGFSDNFDDAYKSSPAWDPAIIARRPDGELWESRNWTGENSYIIGLAKYMAGPGPERIRYTCGRYKLRNTYLVDVLSYYSIRNDWDPAHPASGVKNLEDGRYKVLDAFKKCGLDIVSEDLRYALVGKISVTDNGPAGEESPFGGGAIPLVATIYRHSAIWGMHGTEWRKQPELYSLFYNGHEFPGIPDNKMDHVAAFYYGVLVPWYQVHYRNIESFRRDGDRTLIGLEGNSSIDLDWRNDKYTVIVDGVEVAKDGNTYCPIGKDRIGFYSKTGRQLTAPLPAGWNDRAIVALSLFPNKAEEVPVVVRDGKVTVDVPAERPVMVFRDGASASIVGADH